MHFVSAITSQLAKPKHCLLLLNPQTTPKLKQVNLPFFVIVVAFVVGLGVACGGWVCVRFGVGWGGVPG